MAPSQSLFIPKKPKKPTSPLASPTSPQERASMEDWKRAMIESEPEVYQNESKFGPITGIPVGATWSSREDCAKAGMHTLTTAGISGGKYGAYSIVMSGGYRDDIDEGDMIVYTGTGGYEEENRYGGGSSRSWGGGIQARDQTFGHKHNNQLLMSYRLAKPVRVIRGSNLSSRYAPYEGYRYDGIYKVTKAYTEKSRDDFQICRFELRREPGQPNIPTRWKQLTPGATAISTGY